ADTPVAESDRGAEESLYSASGASDAPSAGTADAASDTRDAGDAPEVPDAPDWEGDGTVEMAPDDGEWGGDAPARTRSQNGEGDEADATELAREHESLTDHLHRQALSLRLSEVDRAALRFLIESLNDDGYLDESLESLAVSLAGEEDPEQVEELVHRFT
ncbi:RNA polymerase factor sigma-54, partial [Rhizobium leguminosarum]|nr:RNA polymerase factor sigma-54 [Rhizobium ruizarguesonis]